MYWRGSGSSWAAAVPFESPCLLCWACKQRTAQHNALITGLCDPCSNNWLCLHSEILGWGVRLCAVGLSLFLSLGDLFLFPVLYMQKDVCQLGTWFVWLWLWLSLTFGYWRGANIVLHCSAAETWVSMHLHKGWRVQQKSPSLCFSLCDWSPIIMTSFGPYFYVDVTYIGTPFCLNFCVQMFIYLIFPVLSYCHCTTEVMENCVLKS